VKNNRKYFKKYNKIPTTSLEYYKYVKVIGKGAFGIATLGIHKLTGKYVAIKTIKKSYIKDEYSKRKVFQEIFILKKIRHSNIIRLLEVFDSTKHILLVMEYANGGDLLHFVRNVGKLPEYDTKHIFRQILYGLAHCHCRSVMHRDIKLDNILLDSNSNIKIWDFGIAKIINRGVKVKEQWGTPAYMAPEIMNDDGYETFYPDFWSLGVLLYAMLYGTVPFKANNMEELHILIQKGEFEFPPEASEQAKSLINGLIRVEPKFRLTLPQILCHPWLKEICEESESSDGEQDTKEAHAAENNESQAWGEEDLDLKNIGANINYVNVDNLFFENNYSTKLSYTDYWSITEDYYTHHLNENAINKVAKMGYPRDFIIRWLNNGDLNHATATYYLLVLD
jgi:serine/threonine protein kinase